METELIEVRTGDREVVLDLTDRCARFVAGRADGLLHVFVPHATAGIAVLETGAGSDDDLLAAMGTWQSICLVDLNVDNPDRQVRLSFLAG